MSVSGRRALTVTTWAGWAEWQEVYSLLFAIDDPAARARGVARVATWRSRGKLPLAIEATASLVEAGLASTGAQQHSEHAMRLMHAMVITRFVNGVVDPLQQFARAVSVKRLAQDIALPTALVDLRHECTHQRLPSLASLRLAADEALLWLHEHYWLPQRNVLTQLPCELHACLARYRDACGAGCLASKKPPPKEKVAACVAELRGLLAAAAWQVQLLPLLLDGGFLAGEAAPGDGGLSGGGGGAGGDSGRGSGGGAGGSGGRGAAAYSFQALQALWMGLL